MKCPSFEQIYDMDLDNLLTLKKDIEQNKINFNTIPLNEDDFDLYDNNSFTDKESILNLINSEIKERESTKELLNFFNDLNFENNIENKFLAELNAKAENNNKNIFELKNKENIPLNKEISDTNKIFQKPIKFPAHEDMKSFLNRTKIDPSKLQYKVSSNKFIEKFWSFDKEKKLRKKHSDLSDVSSNLTNFSSKANNSKNSCVKIKNIKGNRSRLFSEKIVIGAIDIKKETIKKKRKKKKIKENNEAKKINTLELRRNYKVSDITQFLKKKTSLKPLDVPNNLNKDKNCFNNEVNSLNIKVFNKKDININKETTINEESKLQENKKINNIIKNENKITEEEKKNNIILERFYFSFEKGSFKEIKSDILIENLNDVKLKSKIDKPKICDKIFNNIDMNISNNISFILKGKNNKFNAKTSSIETDINNNNSNLKEKYNSQNVKNINDEKEEKLLENNKRNDNQQYEQIIKIDNEVYEQKEEKNKKELNLNIIKENEKNSNIEIAKETEQCEEYEEEEEEEIEQNDILNDNKNVYINELVNKNHAIIQAPNDKNNDLKYVLKSLNKENLI